MGLAIDTQYERKVGISHFSWSRNQRNPLGFYFITIWSGYQGLRLTKWREYPIIKTIAQTFAKP